MKQKNSTKRTLALSLLVMLLCVAMLVGTTFAWFTDSATSSGNKIKAGTLNIDLLVKNASGGYESVKDSQDDIFDYDKWEPGYTEVRNVKVSTDGNLALKYTLSIVPKSSTTPADLKLAEVIDVYYASREVNVTDRTLTGLTKIGTLKDVLNGAEGTIINDTLIPNQNTEDYATIVLKMQESAGNDYQGLSVGDGFDLNLVATQYTYESDSFNNQYDASATYPTVVNNSAELAEAVKQPGGTVKLANDITLDNALKISNAVTIDGGGHSINYSGTGYGFETNLTTAAEVTVKNCVFNKPVNNWANTVVTGITYQNCTFNGGDVYITPSKNNPTITIENCTFNGAMLTIDFMNTVDGTLNAVLRNNTFNVTTPFNVSSMHEGVGLVMFIREDSGFYTNQNSKVNITVEGNTFKNPDSLSSYCAYQIIQTWEGHLTNGSIIPAVSSLNTSNTFDEGAVYSWANYSPWSGWSNSISG